MGSDSPDITTLLRNWTRGDRWALDQLTALVYPELLGMARKHLGWERYSHTLQPTALVHEAWFRLMRGRPWECEGRSHFLGVAAKAMRSILVDYARRRGSLKRDGGARVPLDDNLAGPDADAGVVTGIHDALSALEQFDPRMAEILELRYFGGLEMTEIAGHLGVSPATVRREMRLAEAWLRRQLAPGHPTGVAA